MPNANNQKTESAHKRILIPTVLVATLLLGALGLVSLRPQDSSTDTLPVNSVSIGAETVAVEVADEPNEWTQGLSGEEGLGQDKGMLFVFSEPKIPSFWMKDMNFAIDIIWINEDNVIVGIEESISPDSYPQTYSPNMQVKYVLEVNAGYADIHQISPGDGVEIKLAYP